MMVDKVLILGGTAEARRLAALLHGRPNLEVVSSLAGRVRDPVLPVGEVRIGGFGGEAGLVEYLRAARVTAVVDATHPFAEVISHTAVQAARAVRVPVVLLRRPEWRPVEGDRWHEVSSLPEAAKALDRFGERVFLTIGRRGLATFAGLDRHWFLVRTVDPPEPPVPRRMRLLLDRGPFTEAGELALLREHRIDVLVTKNSGGAHTAAKLRAARELGIPVLMQARPEPPEAPVVETVPAAAAWVERSR